jgi:PTH1 family peptidyl-tRNA hydrolase
VKKYLIAGLGNPGAEYENTRHNIGFKVLDALAGASNIFFTPDRYASVARYNFKGKTFVLIKPSTYMNLSGKAVRYWLETENIPVENLLIITDDLALPYGTLRMRTKGSDGGHNGLKSIINLLQTQQFARIRFGIGSEFSKGQQVDYVLGEWNDEEKTTLQDNIQRSAEMATSFVLAGAANTMNQFNSR